MASRRCLILRPSVILITINVGGVTVADEAGHLLAECLEARESLIHDITIKPNISNFA
jgi:hypothetical protein